MISQRKGRVSHNMKKRTIILNRKNKRGQNIINWIKRQEKKCVECKNELRNLFKMFICDRSNIRIIIDPKSKIGSKIERSDLFAHSIKILCYYMLKVHTQTFQDQIRLDYILK